MATLSVENEIRSFLTAVGLDLQRFAQICPPSVSYAALNRALNNIKDLDSTQDIAARKTMRDLNILIRLCEPLPISFKNPAIIKDLLTKLEKGQLKIDIHFEE